jgi:hypothetical protein
LLPWNWRPIHQVRFGRSALSVIGNASRSDVLLFGHGVARIGAATIVASIIWPPMVGYDCNDSQNQEYDASYAKALMKVATL